MSERIFNHEVEQSHEAVMAKKLEKLLQEKTSEECEVTEFGGTYEIDTDTFFLTFTIEEDVFVVRSIESREVGVGSAIISTIKQLALEEDMTIVASNVLDTAIGFWKKMGFEETSIDGEYEWRE